jgi:hypothetical protein
MDKDPSSQGGSRRRRVDRGRKGLWNGLGETVGWAGRVEVVQLVIIVSIYTYMYLSHMTS